MKQASNFKIRKAKLSDVQKIYMIGQNTKELRFSRKMHFHEKREIRSWITDKRSIILIAEHSDQAIGFLYAIFIDKDWCMLDNIAVIKKFRNKGAGGLLFDSFSKLMKKTKATYVSALVDKDYKDPQNFWKEKGFKEERTFIWYGEDIK